MNKIVLVDDNQMTLNGLCHNVPWLEHGIVIAATADNGSDALLAIEQHRPDLVITDIVMPLMSGIELAEQLRIRFPEIKVIFISAHDEFEYAQKALQLGSIDYVTKPLDYDYLLDSALKAIADKRTDEVYREQIRQSIGILRERTLLELLNGNLEPESMAEDLAQVGIVPASDSYVCLAVEMDHRMEWRKQRGAQALQIASLKLENTIAEVFASFEQWRCLTPDYRIAVLLVMDCEMEIESMQRVRKLAEQVAQSMLQLYAISVSIGIGEPVTAVGEAADSFRQAKEALGTKFLEGNNQVFAYGAVHRTKHSLNFPKWEERLLAKVKFGNGSGMAQDVQGLRKEMMDRELGGDYIKYYLFSLYMKAVGILYELGVADASDYSWHYHSNSELEHFSTAGEWFDWLQERLKHFSDAVDRSRGNSVKSKAHAAAAYIRQHYREEEMGLQEVARAVGVSPNYLSSVFKEEIGITIIEYITRVRMDMAKRLLLEGEWKVHEVGEQVGYANPYYFSACFKNRVGLSPSEYRKKHAPA